MRKLTFLLVIIISVCAIAQDNKVQSSRSVKLGDEYFRDKTYIGAIKLYKQALTLNPDNSKAKYQLAECYRNIQDYESAEYYYESITDQGVRFPLVTFYHAQMQKLKGRYDQALQNFKEFRSFLEDNELHESDKYRTYYKQAKIEIDGCQLALNQITLVHPDHQFEALAAPLNSEFNDYAAFSLGSDDVLMLTSARSEGKGSLVDNQFGETFVDVFRFERKNGNWEEYDEGDKFEKTINTKYGDGSGSFNKERTKFYYTNCDEDLGGICHIYVSKLVGGKWS
ncbi:MAG: tetratricopeptide repeat protein, partial [Ekhidna sp.]